MARYLFIRGNRNKRFFIDIANQLKTKGHECYLIKLEIGELFYKSNLNTAFAPFKVSQKEYPISDDDLLKMPIYNITYKKRVLNKNISKRELRLYKRYMYWIDQFLEENQIDVICLFNGYHWIDQIAGLLAREKNLKTYFFEDGLFRPITVTCDSKGINASSSVPQDSLFYDSIKVDKGRLKKFLYKAESDRLQSLKKENLFKVALIKGVSMLANKIGLHPNYYTHITFYEAVKYFIFKFLFSKMKNESLELPKEYVFLPFQVSRDTQIFYNSSNIKTMGEFLDIVYKSVYEVNNRTGRNIHIIVKEHPEDISRNNYKELKHKYTNNENVTFLKKYNMKKLLDHSLAVITINSTVGIEALSRHKKVITLGEALYNIDGVVNKCERPDELTEVLLNTLNSHVNIELIDKFLYYLRFIYQIEGTIRTRSIQTAMNIAERISIED